MVSAKNLPDYLGQPAYTSDRLRRHARVGVVTGLAWTPVGGKILYIEGVSLPGGNGALKLTGQLGNVMQESANAAFSYLRSRFGSVEEYRNFFTRDLHIHVPAGAIPKDGPSAGIAMATALISALTHRAVNKVVAMTGEITLRGRVLPIGGLKEKLLAAHRALGEARCAGGLGVGKRVVTNTVKDTVEKGIDKAVDKGPADRLEVQVLDGRCDAALFVSRPEIWAMADLRNLS